MQVQALSPEESLGLPPFRPRWPWWGPDLQTLRDTLRPGSLPPERSTPVTIPVGGGDCLLALLDRPAHPSALVIVVPGLGGDAEGLGPRRLALHLRSAGFATLRLNLRGAGAGRLLAGGTYAARCDQDVLPALIRARALAAELATAASPLPLAAVGISLGGTILLNACHTAAAPGVAALVCISSPLDLADCSAAIGKPRNAFYQRWLVRRLRRQTLADPRPLAEAERRALEGSAAPRTIRDFDARITAPRWGYGTVEDYYAVASPLPVLLQRARGHREASETQPGAATLLIHAWDDPWVPAKPTATLAARLERASSTAKALEVVMTTAGGHCGFHDVADPPLASWADRLTAAWLTRRLG